jgi:hypothetical protein
LGLSWGTWLPVVIAEPVLAPEFLALPVVLLSFISELLWEVVPAFSGTAARAFEPPACANANVGPKAKMEAKAIVVSFMFSPFMLMKGNW